MPPSIAAASGFLSSPPPPSFARLAGQHARAGSGRMTEGAQHGAAGCDAAATSRRRCQNTHTQQTTASGSLASWRQRAYDGALRCAAARPCMYVMLPACRTQHLELNLRATAAALAHRRFGASPAAGSSLCVPRLSRRVLADPSARARRLAAIMRYATSSNAPPAAAATPAMLLHHARPHVAYNLCAR